MVKNKKLLQQLEDRYSAEERLTYREAFKLFAAMWEEGKNLGVLPLKDPLEDIETDIKIARILNSCLKKS